MSQWTAEIRRRLASAGLNPAREADIAHELAQHLDDAYADAKALGKSEEEARRLALAELDDERMPAELRKLIERETTVPPLGDARRRPLVSTLWQDARYALRMLRRNPGFAALAILTLAIGIGATTIVYAVVDNVLLRPLPYPEADRIVRIFETRANSANRYAVSYPNFMDWRARSRSIEYAGITASSSEQFILMDGDPVRAPSYMATPDLFAVFGAPPVLGRGFTEADMVPGAERVAVISHGAWQRRFGADPSVVGREVRTLSGPYRIVGVLPESFAYLRTVDFWLPFRLTEVTKRRSASMFNVTARLHPGVTVEQARSEMDAIAASLRQHPENKDAGALLLPMHEQAVGHLRPTLKTLTWAAVCILLIGCVNVAGLLVARGAGRAGEVAIRASLGASPGRIARQLATESTVLALAGGSVGALLAWWGLKAVIPLLPLRLPAEVAIAIDVRVLAVACAASLLTGLLFGAAPAIQLSRRGAEGLRDGARSTSAWARRAGAGLVLAQIALSLVLATGAGLLVRSLQAMTAIDPGLDVRNTLTLWASPLLPRGSNPARRDAFYRTLLERVGSIPGVQAVAAIDDVPFNSASYFDAFTEDGTKHVVSPRYVTTGYFGVMGLRLLAGRDLAASDRMGAPCAIVVNDFAAKTLWPGEKPLGRRLRFEKDGNCEVVGVVSDARHLGPLRDYMVEVYKSALQQSGATLAIVARASDPSAVAAAVAAQVAHAPERALPGRVATFATANAEFTADARRRATLFGLLATIGVMLAAVGVFSLTAYSVTQRTREIGVRMALGASSRRVLWAIVRSLVLPIALGVAAGILGSWWATKTIQQFLYGVTATDPLTFAAVAALLAAIALAASCIPARRALRVDPVTALRAE